MRSRVALRSAAIAALAALLLHCGDDRETEPPPPAASAAPAAPAPDPNVGRIEAAMSHAVVYLANPGHFYDHAGFYLVHFLYRRFELPLLSRTATLYQMFRAQAPNPTSGIDLFERLIDPAAQLDAKRVAAIPHPVDRFTVAALYCQQIPVARDYEAQLREMMKKGGYELTHVALAIGWLEENGCEPQLPTLRAEVVQAMAAGVKSDPHVDDIELESAALLHYLGRGDLVPPDYPISILPAQRGDGGWPDLPTSPRSDWHPTVFALWVLLESQGYGNGAPMIPRAN